MVSAAAIAATRQAALPDAADGEIGSAIAPAPSVGFVAEGATGRALVGSSEAGRRRAWAVATSVEALVSASAPIVSSAKEDVASAWVVGA